MNWCRRWVYIGLVVTSVILSAFIGVPHHVQDHGIYADDECIVLTGSPYGNSFGIGGTLVNYTITLLDVDGIVIQQWSNLQSDLEIDLTMYSGDNLTLEVQHNSVSNLFVSMALPPALDQIIWDEFEGSDPDLQLFPDANTNYLTYFFDQNAAEDCAVKISGIFPNARYFNVSVYDADTRNPIANLTDWDISPAENSSNPFVAENFQSGQNFEIAIGADHLDLSGFDNTVSFPQSLNRAAIFLRYYYPRGGPWGSSGLPPINFQTIAGIPKNPPPPLNGPVVAPSEIESIINDISTLFFNVEQNRDRYFFRATNDEAGILANPDNEYLIAPVTLGQNEVVVLRWRAPSVADDFSNLSSADVRYFSMSLSDQDTRNHWTLGDDELIISPGGYIDLVISRTDAQVKSKASGINYMEWPDPIGQRGYLLYRNILTRSGFPGDLRQVPSVTVNPLLVVLAPSSFEAVGFIGDYAPQGEKMSRTEYLASSRSTGK